MTSLGAAIPPPPSTQLAAVAENALDAWLRERGDTLVLIKQILEAQQETQRQLASVISMLANAASSLAARAEQPAPVVHVTTPEPAVAVTVEAAPVHVQMMEAEKPEKSREVTTVERDSEGRIVRTITEEVE